MNLDKLREAVALLAVGATAGAVAWALSIHDVGWELRALGTVVAAYIASNLAEKKGSPPR